MFCWCPTFCFQSFVVQFLHLFLFSPYPRWRRRHFSTNGLDWFSMLYLLPISMIINYLIFHRKMFIIFLMFEEEFSWGKILAYFHTSINSDVWPDKKSCCCCWYWHTLRISHDYVNAVIIKFGLKCVNKVWSLSRGSFLYAITAAIKHR